MHIVHLALAVDAIVSILIDLVEIPDLILGDTRDQRLGTLWNNYQVWCEAIRHLLAKKHVVCFFFTLSALSPKKESKKTGTRKYAHHQIQRPFMHIDFAKKMYEIFSTLWVWCILCKFNVNSHLFSTRCVNICRNKGVPDRAARRFFTTTILRPNGGTAYPAVSQKILSATACRYMIMWCASLVAQFDLHDENHLCLGSFI